MDAAKIGDFLAALRKARGYTQQAVAERLNLSNKTISKWESGGGLPDITVLPALAELYGVTVDEILAGQRLEGKPAGAPQTRCRETGEYLLRRSSLVMNLCCLFAVCVVVLDLVEKLLYFVLKLMGGAFIPGRALPYLHLLAVFALLAGIIVQRHMLSAARDVAPEPARKAEYRRMWQKALFLLTPLALHLTQLCLRLSSFPLFSILSGVVCAAIVLAWILLAKKWPGFLCRGSGILLLLAAIELVVGYAIMILKPDGIDWYMLDWVACVYALYVPDDLLLLAAGAVQWASERKK